MCTTQFNSMKVILVLLAVTLLDARTVFEFSRSLDTCDEGDTRIEPDGTTNVIWSYGDSDPTQNDVKNLMKHSSKGSHEMTFGQTDRDADQENLEPDTKIVRLLAPDIMIPCCEPRLTTDSTTYYYQMGFDAWEVIPEADENNAVYLTKWDMHFDKRNFAYIHHGVVGPCDDLDQEDLDPENWGESRVGVPPKLGTCWFQYSPLCIWNIGGSGQTFPSDVGYKIGGPDGLRYLYVELHYNLPHYMKPEDQPDFQPPELVQDHSGFEFYYTVEERKYIPIDAMTGIDIDPETHVIPPGQEKYISVAIADPECVRDVFPPGGEVRIFQSMVHGHSWTTSIKTRHIRDGRELKPIRHDAHYDNYYQRYIDVDVVWKPGDWIITECTTDTSMEKGPVRGGLPTDMEMCFTNLMIYPKFTEDILWLASVDQRHLVPGQFLSTCANRTFQYPKFIPYEEEEPCLGVGHAHPAKGDPEPSSLYMFDGNKFQHSLFLDPNFLGGRDSFKLRYSIDKEDGIIHFGVEAETDGWFGFGISANGGMKDSDVVIGWVDDNTGKAYLYDMYAADEALPICDTNQDYFNVKGMQIGVRPYFASVTDTQNNTQQNAQYGQYGQNGEYNQNSSYQQNEQYGESTQYGQNKYGDEGYSTNHDTVIGQPPKDDVINRSILDWLHSRCYRCTADIWLYLREIFAEGTTAKCGIL